MSSASHGFSLSSTIKLNDKILMPCIHLNVSKTCGAETTSVVTHALHAGYRAIDSAEWYGNEAEVGAAILKYVKDSEGRGEVLTREDVWFTTKLKENVSYDETRRKIRESIGKCGLGYLDLYLLHSPYGGKKCREECWRAVTDAVKEGEVRLGGVSNFGVKHLQELLASSPQHPPTINQIDVDPFNTRTDITSFCASNNIVIQAAAPLSRVLRVRNPVVVELSKKYACTPSQLVVRWSLQKEYVPLPKGKSKETIEANANVSGFVIEEGDMGRLDGCDEGLVNEWDVTNAE